MARRFKVTKLMKAWNAPIDNAILNQIADNLAEKDWLSISESSAL